jgi:polyphosphate kinase 2
MVLFEGRDTAGKGGVIKAIMERVSPRTFRVVALPAPSDREKSQMYVQRYLPHFPAAGEIVIWDRSWYNRAGVERVMGFTPDDQVQRFLDMVPAVEKAIVDSGIILLKYWLEVSPEEQTRRLEGRINDPRKVWKLTDMDLRSYTRWDDYTQARDEMFAATSTSWAPWFVAVTDDKKRGRLNIIRHLLDHVPYEPLAAREVTLPKRAVTAAAPPQDTYHHVPDRYSVPCHVRSRPSATVRGAGATHARIVVGSTGRHAGRRGPARQPRPPAPSAGCRLVDARGDGQHEDGVRVLQLLPSRLTLPLFGEHLLLCQTTDGTHAEAVYRRLGARSRDEAVARNDPLARSSGTGRITNPAVTPSLGLWRGSSIATDGPPCCHR